ncbi:hypothetical protein [Streptomyces parvulus]|uniref:hypothetical protein n=1 Tax=Streptomyces parvulus TaxID=146923 RepID=UPI00381570F7
MKWYAEGPFLREVVTSETSKATRFYRVQPGQFIYNRLFAWKGSFGLVGRDLAGSYVSNEFPLFDCDRSRLLPEFLNLHFGQESVWSYVERVSTGTTASRSRWKESQFNDHKLALPSPAEQRRIVDVMAAVDTQIEALNGEVEKSRYLLRCALADHFGSVVGDECSIVELCSHVIGGIWGSPEGENEVDVLALGPRIYAPATAGFVTEGSPVRSFSLKQVESRLVQPNDIILERSGGSPEQPVGRVAIAGEGLSPCVPTDFQRLMRPNVDRADPRYLFWRLQHDWNSGLTRTFSRRTTGITNLSVKEYIAREVPVPSREEQNALVGVADITDMSINAVKAELDHLRTFRSALLTALLSQEIEVPESYDALLEGVS